jgi:DNA-binding NarL/FixJ family response regulator
MKKTMKILIITRSIVLQQGLGALIEALPGILSVDASKELANAYSWIEVYQPDMALLDVALLGEDVQNVLETLRRLSPDTQRVLLVDHVDEVRWVPRYAEAIVIKGDSPTAVAGIVTNLLFSKGDEDEHSETDV